MALAPKVSATQTGVLFDGKDFQALGAAANHALLMTYEWGYRYGPPMAVAPLDQVRRVVTYAAGVIPPGKLSLGLANYGYDWPLPYQKGITSAVTIGNVEACLLYTSSPGSQPSAFQQHFMIILRFSNIFLNYGFPANHPLNQLLRRTFGRNCGCNLLAITKNSQPV